MSIVKSRQRIIDHGEVFTPPGLVREMLDLVGHECERIDSRFLEPACGDGNFLAEVLRRKLATVDRLNAKNRAKWERDAILAICSIYGIDLLPDNVVSGRERMLRVLAEAHGVRFGEPLPEPAARAAAFILKKNIVQGDALTLCTADGRPIVFSEWSPVNSVMLKRRDFAYGQLLDHSHTARLPLFNELGEDVFVPVPISERPLCHYLKVPEQDRAAEPTP